MDLEFWEEHPEYKKEVEPSKILFYQYCIEEYLSDPESGEEGEE